MSIANKLTGKTLSNRYEVLRPLGEGGMGKVYLAKDKRFGKQVVVKVPTMEAGDKDFKDRFMREIASLATLEHPHIVSTLDWGEIEGIPFLVLRYLGGGSLRDRITDKQGYYKPMPLESLNQWLPQVALALDFIHTKNWVHRDLKPDNILFDEAGNPYLADFGIAKALEGAPMGVKTTMGAFIGTPQYMAPEMHLGKGIGPRADQFGLAVLVYEALAGKIPFAGATPTAIFVEVMQGKAKPIHELVPGIPLEKSNALMKGITKEPRDRYGSCVEFANAVTGSILARGASSVAGSGTPSRVVIPGTRIETPQKADILGTRIEPPSKPELANTSIQTPLSIPLAIPVSMHSEIPETKIATPTTSEIVGTRLEKPSKIDSKPNLKLTSEDYLTKAGLGLEQVCKDLVASGKVTKELFLEARKFCKSNDVSEMAGGVLLAEKIESIVKTGHVSVATSQEIISLAREILGLEKPVIAGTRLETPLKPEITGTRLERKVAQAPVIKELKDEREDELGFERPEKKEGNNSGIFVLTGVIGCILLMGIIWIITLGGKKGEPIVANSESSNEESKANKKAKQMELVKLKQEDLGQGIKLEMVLISAGKFMMGSPEFEEGRFLNENQHEVVLTRPFYMGKYEVTQEQWEAVMGYNPSRTKGAKLPVTDVSWEDCQEFIKKLNTKTNGGYRLPTEAEWEYSCRAGTTSAYSFGHSLTKSNANIDGYKISPVGSYEPNVFGLFDMHGNVWEWCEDWYENYLTTTLTDPKGSATGKSRMLRGGSFNSNVSEARSSFRDNGTPAARSYSLGFRLARTADVKAAVESPTPKPDPAETIPTLANSLVSPFTEAKAKEVQKKVAKDLQNEVEEKEDLGKGIKLEMVLIPSGKFKMGSPTSEKGRSDNETQHEVTLTRPYYMGKYEVTQEQWESVMGENPSSTKGTNLPVTNVSWEDCQAFIKKLNAKTNGGYRLPTEAEWEYACRAGTTTAYSVGDNLWQSVANIDGNSIKVVGSYKPNAFGLYDMHGNVWEWCEDCKADYPVESVTDPKGPATGISRVMRGGSYGSSDSGARSSFRNSTFAPIFRYSSEGFRLARTADVKTAVLPSTPKPAPAESMPTVANSLVSPFTEAKAKEVQKEVAKILQREVEVREDLGNGIKLEMVLIPAGKFMMGSPESEEGRNEEEKQHEVIITNPFYMGKYEVTQEQWDTVMGNNSIKIDQFKKSPVTQVSWEDCQDFVKKLNAKTNGGYRLPTEAEWEYSCRSGTNSAFAFGDNLTDLHAKFCKNIVYSAQPRSLVGIYPPNAWGLHDMHGNVWEWCGDRYGAYPAGTVTDPKGPATGTHHVLRGGSASVQANECRSAIRGEASLDRPNPSGKGRYEVIGDFGFRLARTADVKTAVLPSTPKTAPAESMPTVANSLVSPFTEAKAKEVQKEVAKILQREVKEKEDLGKDIKLEMVLIPAGKFKMGSPTSEKGRSDNETQHEVTLTKPYYMGKYEVTQEQWESVMGNNPSSTKGAKLPVTNVSWEDCQEFIKMLNAKTKGGYRLPTEAEWEYSCRAGTTTAYSFGDSLTNSDANIKGSSIKVVGSYKPNAFGLFDMHGNVWEWCEDWKAYYQAGAVTDPKGSVTGICRVLRGGSFDNSVSYARSSSRYDFAPTVRPDDYGFRLARNP